MAQNALTVTPPNPTPPTNFACTGASPPNVPNYTKNTYNDPKNWSAVNPKDFPPPYFDDGNAGPLTAFIAPTAALASGSAATAGGTEGTYPGAAAGAVPASTSVAHEGAGTEVSVTAPGSRAECPTVALGVGPTQTAATLAAGPNAGHASSLSPATAPALASITPGSTVSGVGATTLTATGTNFTRQSVVWVNGVPQTTVFVSATSLTCAAVTKKTTAGAWPVVVITGGVITTAAQTWTFT
jgi:hypothetical protein